MTACILGKVILKIPAELSNIAYFRRTESIVDAHGPRHPLFPLDGRKDFCGILEGDRSFTEREGDSEQIHKTGLSEASAFVDSQ